MTWDLGLGTSCEPTLNAKVHFDHGNASIKTKAKFPDGEKCNGVHEISALCDLDVNNKIGTLFES